MFDTDGTLLDSVGFGDQVTDISYGRDPDGSINWYTMNPTPGWSSTGQSVNLVADTKFSMDWGFYDEPIEVEITCATKGATIFYTTNFEEPEDTPHEFPITAAEHSIHYILSGRSMASASEPGPGC